LQDHLDNRHFPNVYGKSSQHQVDKLKKRQSKKQQPQPSTRYLINYPISSLSDSPSNQSFVTSFQKSKDMHFFPSIDNDTNTTSNVNSNLIDSSSSNILTIPLEVEQTKSTVILSEFKLS
jgi:hypothetical protein